ncbi:MAG: efflux transporter periplasmic adaptor subunit [Gammaproteobacteria bacterium]|nr:efflux transporter periplasmic adaptor subunit [Gammaproteobacteria bacterium]
MIRDTSAQDRPLSTPPRRLPRLPARWWLPAAGAVVLLALSAYAARDWMAADRSVAAERLRIATVYRGDLVRDIAADGRVTAADSPTLYAVAAGTVDLAVVAGDAVARGEVLARLTSPELESRLAQEQATLDALEIEAGRAELDVRQGRAEARMQADQAEIDRQTAARELERLQQGFDLGVVSELDLLRAKDALVKAEIALDHARRDAELRGEGLGFDLDTVRRRAARQQAVVAELQRQVAELVVRSPVDGQVGQVHVEQRANVAANAPLLQVVDLTAFEVEIDVPESFARDLGIGMPADIRVAGTDVPGTVRSVSPQVVNGRVVGRLRFDGEPPAGLRQNQRVTARIVLDEKADALLVERGPFLEAGQGRFAYRVRDGIAERVPLATGVARLDAVEIIDGAEVGDRIVVSGVEALGDAGRVRLSGL